MKGFVICYSYRDAEFGAMTAGVDTTVFTSGDRAEYRADKLWEEFADDMFKSNVHDDLFI